MTKILPFLIGTAAICLMVFSYLIKDTIRDWIIMPFLELLRLIDMNQSIVWTFFLIMLLIFAGIKILQNLRIIPFENLLARRQKRSATEPKGQLESIMGLLEKAPKGQYFKIRLAKHLSLLITEILAYENQTSPDDILTQLKMDELILPDAILKFMKAGLYQRSVSPTFRERWIFWHKPPKTALDIDPIIILDFLESRFDLKPTV